MQRATAGERFLVTRRGQPSVRLIPAVDQLDLKGGEIEAAQPRRGMSQIDSPTTEYVKALVGIGGQLVSSIDHMRRHSNAVDDDSLPEILTRLLTDIVGAEVNRPPDDLYTSAAVLDATAKAIEENLFLVD
jgi:antitoxin (DNA-binding transcriptional repressor) of toxin-antitoxin stability system